MRDFTRTEKLIIEEIIDEIHMGIEELSAMIIQAYAPTLWVDFLNADPEDSESMWGVYYEFVRFMETIQGRHYCSRDIMEMELMSKVEFLDRYPAELQGDARKLHHGMKRVIDEGRSDVIGHLVGEIGAEKKRTQKQEEEAERAHEMITGGASIPLDSFTASLQLPEEDGDFKTYLMNLHAPAVNHRNFWLSIILTGVTTLSCKDGEITVRKCAAPDCRKYFLPAPHSIHRQIYHSQTCRSRHNMQKRRGLP